MILFDIDSQKRAFVSLAVSRHEAYNMFNRRWCILSDSTMAGAYALVDFALRLGCWLIGFLDSKISLSLTLMRPLVNSRLAHVMSGTRSTLMAEPCYIILYSTLSISTSF